MIPCYYTKLLLRNLSLHDLRAYYVDWALGLGPFANLRHRRIESGVPSGLAAIQAGRGGTFHGMYECRIDTRGEEGRRFLLQLSHRDSGDPAVFWHNVIEIESADRGVTLQHGVGRSVPAGRPTEIVVAPPGLIPRILARNGPDLLPRDIADSSILELPPADAATFADYILADRARGVSMLVFTAGSRRSIDASNLDRTLVGLARVVRMTEPASAHAMSDQLIRKGFDRRFILLDGGVRLYLPGLAAGQDPYLHRLWIADRLANMGQRVEDRAEVLSREAAQAVLRHAVPPAYFSAIARFDRRRQSEVATATLAQAALQGASATQAQKLEATSKWAKDLESLLALQEGQIAALQAANDQLELDKMGMGDQLSAAAQQREELEGEIRSKQALIDHNAGALERQKSPAVQVGPDVRAVVASLLLEELTIESALRITLALYPERLVVLPSAEKSAKDSEDFKHADRALRLLLKLAGPYWEALASGQSDSAARQLLGGAFAAMESDTVMKNKRALSLRTFRYNGRSVKMFPHLKIGVKDSAAETWRCHFEWFPDEKRIVIGHCGPHLDHD